MSSNKKRLIIFLILFLFAAIPASVYLVLRQQEIRGRAEPATTITFDPTSLSKNVGETFTLNINIDTGTNNISGVELHIQYDAQKLQALSIQNAATPFLPVVLVDGSVGGGFAFLTLGSQPSTPKRGAGTLATVTFRAAQSTAGAPTLIRFTTDTRVAGTGEFGNVLASQPAAASVTIGTASTPTPSPSATPVPTATGAAPTPTARAGVGAGGTISPTPTRIATSSGAIATASPTLVAVGGNVTVLPTKGPIPETAEVGPTAALTIGGVVLFGLGLLSLLAL